MLENVVKHSEFGYTRDFIIIITSIIQTFTHKSNQEQELQCFINWSIGPTQLLPSQNSDINRIIK